MYLRVLSRIKLLTKKRILTVYCPQLHPINKKVTTTRMVIGLMPFLFRYRNENIFPPPFMRKKLSALSLLASFQLYGRADGSDFWWFFLVGLGVVVPHESFSPFFRAREARDIPLASLELDYFGLSTGDGVKGPL